jgi:hypothetical protein
VRAGGAQAAAHMSAFRSGWSWQDPRPAPLAHLLDAAGAAALVLASCQAAADQLAEILFKFVTMNRRDRIMQRNRVENISEIFDWTNLRSYYDTAHDLALKRKGITRM